MNTSANEVLELPASDIEPPPSFGSSIRSDLKDLRCAHLGAPEVLKSSAPPVAQQLSMCNGNTGSYQLQNTAYQAKGKSCSPE